VPCRGLDEGISENLRALAEQDYPEYEVIFVVDDPGDEAVPVIEDIRRSSKPDTRIVVAPPAKRSSQKVENLRHATAMASERSELFAFADSDARPTRRWLRSLAGALKDERVGAATGYRWFFSPGPTFAGELRNIWNASIASALGPDRSSNFCWGGAMAIRRETFERLCIREKWKGTLSDDFTVTRAVKDAGLEIVFVPAALTPSIESCSLQQAMEFTTRQMKITRVYAPVLWAISFGGSGLFIVVMAASLAIMIFSRKNDLPVLAAMFTLTAVTALSVGKSWLRLSAARRAMPEMSRNLSLQFIPQVTLWAVSPLLFFYNCLAALLSRKVRWRGMVYEMASASETRRIGP
jgi:ceramide glucosyltransferase